MLAAGVMPCGGSERHLEGRGCGSELREPVHWIGAIVVPRDLQSRDLQLRREKFELLQPVSSALGWIQVCQGLLTEASGSSLLGDRLRGPVC